MRELLEEWHQRTAAFQNPEGARGSLTDSTQRSATHHGRNIYGGNSHPFLERLFLGGLFRRGRRHGWGRRSHKNDREDERELAH
jgi:hypothetical protein